MFTRSLHSVAKIELMRRCSVSSLTILHPEMFGNWRPGFASPDSNYDETTMMSEMILKIAWTSAVAGVVIATTYLAREASYCP